MGDRQPTLVFDSFDIDLVVKVFENTLLSPFFALWIPFYYRAHGLAWTSSVVINALVYVTVVCLFWVIKWTSHMWRNGRKLTSRRTYIDWSEQIVVITGGSSGLGELLANTFGVRNVTVVVLDVKPIETENFNIEYYKCDISNWEEVEAVSKKIVEEIGHPTVLINNAGVVQGKLLIDLSPEDIKQTVNTNLLGNFWILKAFLPNMIEKKAGHVVTMSSVMAYGGSAQMTDYAATKAVVANLHDSLRYELDNRYECPKIRTTLVAPGHVHTQMFSHVKLPTNPIRRFFFPSLPPHTVVKEIIAAIDLQESRSIFLPFYARFAPFSAIVPSWFRDFIQHVTTADYAMRDFVKVTGKRPDEVETSTKSG